MPALHEITTYLDNILQLDLFPDDPSNNGLQFQGTNEVRKAVFAVDACEAVFTNAADLDADFIFVHHGLSWGNGFRRITGQLAARVTALAANGISLYAAHLPLDAHPLIGHNALLSQMLQIDSPVPFGDYHGKKIGFSGTLPKELAIRKIVEQLEKELPSEGDFSFIGPATTKFARVGIISGGGAFPELFDEIMASEVELLITGSCGHESFHPALEAGIAVLSLGHYRSETPGVIAVMNSLRHEFAIQTEFIDIPTGL